MNKTAASPRSGDFQRTLKKIASDYQLYLFLLIPVIYILIFSYSPMYGVQIAFRKYTARGGITGSEWVGLKNIIKFFNSYMFGTVLVNTPILSLYGMVACFIPAVVFALALNSLPSARFAKVAQTIANMPHFISIVVLVGMMMQIFNSRSGLYGTIGYALSGEYPSDLFASPTVFRHMHVWSGVWQHTGWNSIIYLAALAGVNNELHEAAEIDGASRFQRVLHVDLPAIRPTMTIMLIMSMGNVLSVGFEKAYLMQNGLNISASEIISTYVYKVGLTNANADFSYSTAIGLFNSVVNLILISIVNQTAKKLSETSLW